MQIKYLLNSEIYDPKLNKSCYQSSKRLDILNNLLKEKNIQIPLSILGFDKAEQHRSPTLVATPTPTRKATNADGTTPSSAAERVAKAEEAWAVEQEKERKKDLLREIDSNKNIRKMAEIDEGSVVEGEGEGRGRGGEERKAREGGAASPTPVPAIEYLPRGASRLHLPLR